MLVGVVSDTHANVQATRQAVRMLESLDASAAIHCGDIGTAAVVELFEGLPTHFVLGNVDHPRMLEEAIDRAGQTCHGRFGTLELGGRNVAFLHGDDLRRLHETIGSGDWDLVCHGHTHCANTFRQGNTVVLNPGAVADADGPSVAVVETASLRVTPVSI